MIPNYKQGCKKIILDMEKDHWSSVRAILPKHPTGGCSICPYCQAIIDIFPTTCVIRCSRCEWQIVFALPKVKNSPNTYAPIQYIVAYGHSIGYVEQVVFDKPVLSFSRTHIEPVDSSRIDLRYILNRTNSLILAKRLPNFNKER